jgi:hypothetical protein
VFGGILSTGTYTNQLLSVTTTGIAVVATTGTAPSARAYAAAVYLPACYSGAAPLGGAAGACIVLFGGYTSTKTLLNDVWVLDMRATTPTWYSPGTGTTPAVTGTAPTARYYVSAVASGDGTAAYFFGGLTAGGAVNDVFAFAPGGFANPTAAEMNNLARPKGVEANTTMSTTDPTW